MVGQSRLATKDRRVCCSGLNNKTKLVHQQALFIADILTRQRKGIAVTNNNMGFGLLFDSEATCTIPSS